MTKNKVEQDVGKLKKAIGKDEREDKAKNIYKTRFTYEEWHYVEFNDERILKFLKYRLQGQGIAKETVSELRIRDPDDPNKEIIVLPAPQIAQTKRDRALREEINEAVKFPPAPIEYGSEYELYCEIKDFIHTFVELKPEDEIILALYVMKAAIFDALKDTSFPFVHVLAPYGKGKSRLLTVMCEITPYGFYSVDIKSAALKRVSDLYGVVLFVDEKGQMDNELAAILNGKYNANALVLNANNEIQQGFSAIIAYRIFGPLMMAGRSTFRDDAIESKSFQVNMDSELSRDDVPRKIKGKMLDDFRHGGREIRGKLLHFRTIWHDKINEIQGSAFTDLYEKHTEPRLFEVISFFEDLIQIIPEIKTEIGTVLEAQILRNVEVAAQTPNGIIANEVLAQMQTDGGTESYTVNGKKFIGIYVSAVYEVVGKEYANQTGRILSALGLRTDRPRITKTRSGPNGEEEENTKRYTMVRIPDEKKIKELKSRYDPEFVSAILSSIEWGSHAILDGWDERDRQKGEGYLETTPKNDNESRELKDGETKNNKNTTPPSQFVRPVRPVSPEVIEEVDNTNVQNEKTLFDDSLWERDTKKALFKFIQSENRSLKPKAIHDMNPDHKIDLPKIYELCEELTHEGSFTKNKDHSYSINPNNVVKAVSEEECQQLINSLKEEGIPVRVNDSGKSYDDRSFKIAVEKSYYSKHKEAVNAKMAEHGFTRSNRGEFDSIFFIQPLKGADSQ